MYSLFRFSLVLLTLCFSSFGGAAPLNQHLAYIPSNTQQNRAPIRQSPASFNTLHVSGHVRLQLVTSAEPFVELLDPALQKKVSIQSKNGTLYIHGSGGAPFQVGAPQLDQLITQGPSLIEGQIFSQGLSIQSEGTSQIKLTGMVNLQHLSSSGQSKVMLYWVNSPTLALAARNSSLVELAGVVGVLHASLSNNAQLKAQYLRAQEAVVQAQDHAYAGVLAIQALRAFAIEESNIFYFKYPRYLNDYSQNSGNVLQVAWRP